MGLIAGVSFTILTALSVKPVRKRFYEFFWITHVIFVMYVSARVHTCASTHQPAIHRLFLIAAVWHCVGAGKA